MSSTRQSKRAWEAPVATRLSIRSTAAFTGPGADTFLKADPYHRPGLAPTAPIVHTPAAPRTEAAMVSDQQGWEAPAVTQLPIRSTAAHMGQGGDTFLKSDPFYRPGLAPAAPIVHTSAAPRTEAAMVSDQQGWEAPAVTQLPIRSTAAFTGPGADTFLKADPYHRPGLAPTAPIVHTPTAPRTEAAVVSGPDQPGWEAPVVTTLSATAAGK